MATTRRAGSKLPFGERAPKGGNRSFSVRRVLPFVPTAVPVVLIPLLEYLPGLSSSARAVLILIALAATVFALWRLTRDERLMGEVERENQELRLSLAKSDPEQLLREISPTLFGQGAWRLTILRKGRQEGGESLRRVVAIASDVDQQTHGAVRIDIARPSQLSVAFEGNLSDPRFRAPFESGAFEGSPDDDPAVYEKWRSDILGRGALVGDESSLRPRKFAWYAAQDPQSQVILLVLLESTAVDGIIMANLRHSSTAAWIFFAERLANLREGATPAAV